MRGLDPQDRSLLRGYYGDGMSCVQLRDRFRLSHAAVRMRLHRAREALRKSVGPLTAAAAAVIGLRADATTWGVLSMKATGKLAVVALGVSALVVGAAWRSRAVPGSGDGTQAPQVAERDVSGTDASVARLPQPRPTEAASSQAADAVGATDRAEAGAAGRRRLTSSSGVATTVGHPAPAGPSDDADAARLGDTSPDADLTPVQREVYDELARILPLKDEVIRKLGEAHQEGAGADRLTALIEELHTLDGALERLVPDAFTREGTPDNTTLSINMDRMREAAGGALPFEPRGGAISISVDEGPNPESSGVQVRVKLK